MYRSVKVRKNDFSRVDFCIHRDFKDIIPADWMLRTGKEKDEKQQGASARGSVADDVEFESGSERLDPKHEASPRLLRERVFAVFAESSETSIPYTQLFAATVREVPPALRSAYAVAGVRQVQRWRRLGLLLRDR